MVKVIFDEHGDKPVSQVSDKEAAEMDRIARGISTELGKRNPQSASAPTAQKPQVK